jgi:hypothetical protein
MSADAENSNISVRRVEGKLVKSRRMRMGRVIRMASAMKAARGRLVISRTEGRAQAYWQSENRMCVAE